jgi:hypothetical protein
MFGWGECKFVCGARGGGTVMWYVCAGVGGEVKLLWANLESKRHGVTPLSVCLIDVLVNMRGSRST